MRQPPVSLDAHVSINDEAECHNLAGHAEIRNMATGAHFILNEATARIFTVIQDQGGSLRAAFEALREESEVAPEVLEADLLQLVTELRENGLVTVAQVSGEQISAMAAARKV